MAGVHEVIEEAGARILHRPPCSPDFNPIAQIFAKLKGPLRTAAPRTVPDLWHTLRQAVPGFTAGECRNGLAVAGYDHDSAAAT